MGLTNNSTGKKLKNDKSDFFNKTAEQRVIALAGNPNVGKSTVFNSLTGMNQHTGNWPGKTVQSAIGYCKKGAQDYVIIDLPGTYSIDAQSAEESVADEFLRSGNADVTVIVCDATCLERNLILVKQIQSITDNVIVCVNLMDEAKKKGININLELLSKRINTPVVGISARKIKDTVKLLVVIDDYFENYTDDRETTNEANNFNLDEAIISAEDISSEVVKYKNCDYNKKDRLLDKIFTGKYTGYPIMLILLFFIFWLTLYGANYPSAIISNLLFGFEKYLYSALSYIKLPKFVCDMIVFGMYRVLSSVVSVMLPPMAIFFPLFTLLEDSGYLPRIAYNLDKPFKCCNTCGKQALTMCMGFGCNAAGVVGCRIIDSKRDRLLAIITNSFVPCNGKFPTLITLIGLLLFADMLSVKSSMLSALLLTLLIIFAIIMTFLVTFILSKTLFKGIPSSFVLELPPYRTPQIGKVIVRSIFDRTVFVLGRAVAIAAPVGVIIWLLANIEINSISLISYLSDALNPVGKFFGLDGVILIGFILGFPANEIVLPIILMIYLGGGNIVEISNINEIRGILSANNWGALTLINTMVLMLFHFPCSTTLLTIKKETGSVGVTILSAVLPTVVGLCVCFIVRVIFEIFA